MRTRSRSRRPDDDRIARRTVAPLSTAGLPRTPDGKPNLSAARPEDSRRETRPFGLWQSASVYVGNIAKRPQPRRRSFQPWAEALYKHRRATAARRPDRQLHSRRRAASESGGLIPQDHQCSGYGRDSLRSCSVRGRQIFTDGRKLRTIRTHVDGLLVGAGRDAFVVDTAGSTTGLAGQCGPSPPPNSSTSSSVSGARTSGTGHSDHDRRSEGLHETVDDDAAARAASDTELLNTFCNENNKYFAWSRSKLGLVNTPQRLSRSVTWVPENLVDLTV